MEFDSWLSDITVLIFYDTGFTKEKGLYISHNL